MGGSGTIRVGGGNLGGNVLNVYNCLFWNNRNGSGTANELTQISVNTNDALPSTVNIINSTLTGWTGTFGGVGNNGANPLFVDFKGADDIVGTEDDDVRLMMGSPAIDSGDNSLINGVFIDLDGDARFEDDVATADTGAGMAPVVDRGAYEFGMRQQGGQRVWAIYDVKGLTNPLGKDSYVVEVTGGTIHSLSRVETTPDAKIDLPRVALIEEKVTGKPPAECQQELEQAPIVTVRSERTGQLRQLYDGRIIKVFKKPYYCILKYDANDLCEDVDFQKVGASTRDDPYGDE